MIKLITENGFVLNENTKEVIFSTEGIDPVVVENVCKIVSEDESASTGRGSTLDTYLLDEELCTEDQREDILNSIFSHRELVVERYL